MSGPMKPMTTPRPPAAKTRVDGRLVKRSAMGAGLWRLRYGRASVDVWLSHAWIAAGLAVEGIGCVELAGEALEVVQTAIAWDKDLRAESRRLG